MAPLCRCVISIRRLVHAFVFRKPLCFIKVYACISFTSVSGIIDSGVQVNKSFQRMVEKVYPHALSRRRDDLAKITKMAANAALHDALYCTDGELAELRKVGPTPCKMLPVCCVLISRTCNELKNLEPLAAACRAWSNGCASKQTWTTSAST